MATVRDIVTFALPVGSRVVAGDNGQDGEVKWVCTIRDYPTLPDDISAGDCVLLAPVPHLEKVQVKLLGNLASLGVAAVGVIGDVPEDIVALADECGLPLISMPQGIRLNDVEKSVITFIFNRQAKLEQRGVQIYRQMAQMVTAGRGIGAIVDQLAEITGKTVTLQNADMTLRFHAGPLPEGTTIEKLRGLLRDGHELREWLTDLRLISTSPPIGQFDLSDSGLARFVAPVIVRESVVGYVSVLGFKQDLTELDHLATGRAASVCAIETAKERAVVEAEIKVRGDFLEDLLASSFLTEEAAIRRGEVLGFNLEAPCLVIVLKPDGPTLPGHLKGKGDTSSENSQIEELGHMVRQELLHRTPQSLLHVQKDAVVVLWPVAEDDIRKLADSIESLRHFVASTLSIAMSAGIGRPCSSARDVPRSFREATQALSVAQNMLGGERTSYIDDLLVHRLLLPLQGSSELSSFYEDSIGKLVAHDQKNGTEMIKTLSAFFAAHGNVNRTAESLFLHRNAVAYRLKRVEAISGLSLDDPEHRLALHLGLKVKDIV